MADPHDTTTPGKSPAFQFYPKDFVTGTLTLTTYEVGAYMLLLCYCWDNGSIPKDVSSMARIARISTAQMRRMWTALRDKFQEGGDGYVQPRIEIERLKQAEYRRRQSDASHKRWDKRGTSTGNATASPRDIPNSSSPVSGLQSSSPDFGQKREARVTGGVMAGSLPRDHVNCRQPCIRVCLTEKQHAILRERHGGTDADLDAFYADVRGRLEPGVPIGETPWKFWDAQFAAKFGAAVVVNLRTAGNAAAAARFVARRQG